MDECGILQLPRSPLSRGLLLLLLVEHGEDGVQLLDPGSTLVVVGFNDVFPDLGQLILRNPAFERVESDFVQHDLHEADVEEDPLAGEAEVDECERPGVADDGHEVVAQVLAAGLAVDAEGVAGVVDFAADGEGGAGGEEVEGEWVWVVDVVVFDVPEDDAAGVVVDLLDVDFAPVEGVLEVVGLGVGSEDLVVGDA